MGAVVLSSGVALADMSADKLWPAVPVGHDLSMEDQLTNRIDEWGNQMGRHLDQMSHDVLAIRIDARRNRAHMRVGYGVAGNDAELVLRGLNSMALRYAAQDVSTRALATWLQSQPQIATVLHPALAGSPGHEAFKRDCSAAACLLSVVFKPAYSQAQVDGFCDNLKLFKLGYSWAGPMSLCAPYDIPAIRSQPWPHKGGLVRFSVGLEAVEDLQADLAQALALMHYS